jgi:hypothetical protein
MDEPAKIFVAYPYGISAADYRSAFSAVEDDYPTVKFVYADEQITSKHILEKIIGMMTEATFSLFDITKWNPNVALELGIAIGSGLDYYILFNPSAESEAVPADLGGIDRIQYRDYAQLREGVGRLMRQQFGDPEKAEPHEQVGGQLLEQVQVLRATIPPIVKGEPGLQIGGIASALGVTVDLAQTIIRPMIGEQLTTRGQRRGMRYYLPEDAPPEERSIEVSDSAAGSETARVDPFNL